MNTVTQGAEIAKTLADEAWEKLPEHGNARSMEDALNEQRGVCLHRSIIIGRRLRALGYSAMRRINFDATQRAVHFCNYYRAPGAESWAYVSTGIKHGTYTEGPAHDLDETAFYASFAGLGFERLEQGGSAFQASAMIFPELSMGLFADCVLAQQYLRKAYRLLG